MTYIAIYVLLACIVTMLYSIVLRAKDIYTKLVAFNSFSTQVVLLITTISVFTQNFFLIDIALLYAGVSFMSTVALMKLMFFNNL